MLCVVLFLHAICCCTHLCHVLQVVAFLSSCQHPEGGYGGGPGQLAHLAPTYAAVSALLTLGGQEALTSINRCTNAC